MPRLVEPTTDVHASFLSAMAEFRAEGETRSSHSMVARDIQVWGERWHQPDVFGAYVAQLRADALPDSPRPEGFVPCSTYWYVDGSQWLGRIAVRHRLTPFLLEEGGHIGYAVRASARRRGHATAMLRAVLPEAARLGVDPALVTCDDDNTASRRVIESAGGVYEDQRGNKLRYWVPAS